MLALREGCHHRYSVSAFQLPFTDGLACFFAMAKSNQVLVRVADLLEILEMNQGLVIHARSIEEAFGGLAAKDLASAEAFAQAHGCSFEYKASKERGLFIRTHSKGGRA